MNLAALQGDVDVVVREHAGIALHDVDHFQECHAKGLKYSMDDARRVGDHQLARYDLVASGRNGGHDGGVLDGDALAGCRAGFQRYPVDATALHTLHPMSLTTSDI